MNPPAEAAIYAVDPGRVAAFYEAVAGLAVAESTPEFIELRSALWRLSIVRIPVAIATGISFTVPVTRRGETPIKLVLPVASLETAREVAAVHGGVVDGQEAEWTWHHTTRCDGHDPEGNVFQCAVPARG